MNTSHLNDTCPSDASPRTAVLGQVLLAFTLGFFIITALAGNLLVIVAILTDRSLRKAGNIFLVSLALADTFVALFVMSFAMLNDVTNKWMLGKEFCKLWISADVMCSTASILNLCAISLDRYVHIKNPLHYDNWVDYKRVLMVVTVLWLMSALISFLPIQLDWHTLELPSSTLHPYASNDLFNTTTTIRVYPTSPSTIFPYSIINESNQIINQSYPNNKTSFSPQPCDDQVCQMELSPMYAVVSSTISFYLPCLAMTLIYYRLLQYAKKHVSHIKMTTTSQTSKPPNQNTIAKTTKTAVKKGHLSVNSASPVRTTTATVTTSSSQYKTSDHKASVTLGIIMGVFLVCWAPFFTVNVVDSFCRCVHPVVFASFTWLGYVNSSMNPVIYGIFNRQFREAFQRVIYTFLWKCCGFKSRYLEYQHAHLRYNTPPNRSFQANDEGASGNAGRSGSRMQLSVRRAVRSCSAVDFASGLEGGEVVVLSEKGVLVNGRSHLNFKEMEEDLCGRDGDGVGSTRLKTPVRRLGASVGEGLNKCGSLNKSDRSGDDDDLQTCQVRNRSNRNSRNRNGKNSSNTTASHNLHVVRCRCLECATFGHLSDFSSMQSDAAGPVNTQQNE